MRFFSKFSLFAAVFALPLMGCDSNSSDDTTVEVTAKTIVETAIDADDFNTLVTAVQAADLVATLNGPGPFTVFAPTDAAFDALPDGTVSSLLEPENRDQLASVLTYHVVSGRVPASDVVNLTSAPTVQGATVDITVVDGVVKVNNATVIQTDIEASNGIIHVIDAVLLPPSN
ncbi:MAG: fasciclin domain-containing protein [Rhodothermales bacterium]|nr:fasciclin domain-containing protein [Rhodothermales bacterium]MBO6779434.1 fasciclin domain-containing protein [Rhodothermales bacterium]